jgi:transposase-like protein
VNRSAFDRDPSLGRIESDMRKQYPSEVRERAVRLVLETRDQYKTQ